MSKVGIIGSGMAGMACAHRLARDHQVTLLEKEPRFGGHTHTVVAEAEDESVPIDTGFMVFNYQTYPEMIKLFAELDVPVMETVMSFGVQHPGLGLEYAGSSLNALFAQRKNILKPRFWQLLNDILRFNRLAHEALGNPQIERMELAAFIRQHGFSSYFRDGYLLPMTSAIWSTPPDGMLRFPAGTLLRFMFNHGLLGVRTRHQWYTVKGGSRQYRDRLLKPLSDQAKTRFDARRVERHPRGATVRDGDGNRLDFDAIVIATHANQALDLLAEPTEDERELLSQFQYAGNPVVLHSDASVMPSKKAAWASWNYRMDREGEGYQASTHYWMNSLQKVSERRDYFVSVNYPGDLDPAKIYFEANYAHPMFDQHTARAQPKLPHLNRTGPVYFCGSYFRYGFHEDALVAGYAAADALNANHSPHAKLAV